MDHFSLPRGDQRRRGVCGECPYHATPPSRSDWQGGREADGQLVQQAWAFRKTFLERFRALNLDALLCPAGPTPGTLHGTAKYWAYTSLFNLNDWPAAVFPTGLFVGGGADEVGVPQYDNENERWVYEHCEYELTRLRCPVPEFPTFPHSQYEGTAS
jgi:hypothetical protein